jgi:hypothetical protein
MLVDRVYPPLLPNSLRAGANDFSGMVVAGDTSLFLDGITFGCAPSGADGCP